MNGTNDQCAWRADRPTLRLLIAVFVVALAARGGWGVYRMARAAEPAALEFPDEEQYWLMARSLADGTGLCDELGFRATRMPLYPGFLSLFAESPHGVALARAAQWVIGALAAVFIVGTATSLVNRRVGCLAGLIVALDPFLIFFSSLLLTETIFITFLCALWWMLTVAIRKCGRGFGAGFWLAVGAVASLCVYSRESSIGLVMGALVFAVLCLRMTGRVLTGAGIALSVVVASLVPWALRNRAVTDNWCWLTHRGGISLYDGVRPGATGGSDLGAVKQSKEVENLSEVEWDRHFRHLAFASIKSDPVRIVRLAGAKLRRMWNPFPNVETHQSISERLISSAWTIPLFAFAIAGMAALSIRRGWSGRCTVVFLLLPALYFSALHSLFVGSVRYRLPAQPIIAVLAAVAISTLFLGRITSDHGEGAEGDLLV